MNIFVLIVAVVVVVTVVDCSGSKKCDKQWKAKKCFLAVAQEVEHSTTDLNGPDSYLTKSWEESF